MRLLLDLVRGTRFVVAAGIGAFACAGLLAVPGAASGDPSDIDRGFADFRQARFAEAFEDWEQAAAAGDPRGALYVGVLYDSGLGVSQDEQQAMAWYRRAADGGSAVGAFNVGVLYDAGLGVAKDPTQAAAWYARAAARGYGRAQYNLAMLYESGTGVPRNRGHAIALYRLAAGQGIAAARVHLAALGEPVTVVAKTPQDVAMQEFREAQQVLLTRGPAEAVHAAELFHQAADRHNALAEYDLGYCYERGLGVSSDLVEAYKWYRRAADDASDSLLRGIAQNSASILADQIGRQQQSQTGAGHQTN